MNELFSIMPDFLRSPDAFFKSIQQNENVGKRTLTLALVSLISFMVHGFTVGFAKSPVQALSASIKVPILFLSTMAFCLPALYFFSLALLGTPLKMSQVLAVVLAGISVTAFLLLGLAPIAFFFSLTSTNYEFFQLLAVAFVGVSASIGVYFLWHGMTLVESARDEAAQKFGRRLLFIWILLYGFVGTQMTWRLSPFIGRPEDPFYLVKPSRDNFYVDVVHAIEGVLKIPASETAWGTPLIMGGLCVAALAVVFFGGGMMMGNLTRKAREEAQSSAPMASAK